jgi:hypothetical protein
MKFQKMLRVQMMLMGLAAGLLLARPVRAQQEMDPTFFETPSDASQMAQADSSASPSLEAANQEAAEAAAALAAQGVEASRLTGADQATIVVLMTGFGSIVFLGIGEAVRDSWRRVWRAKNLRSSPAGGTAN